MLRLLTLLLSCVSVCAQPVLSLNDPTVVAKSSSLLQGLVGYWQLDESGTGTRYDRSRSGLHMTSSNSVGYTNGVVSNCGNFVSAKSQYLSVTNASMAEGTNTVSASAWVYTSATSGVISGRYSAASNKRSWNMGLSTQATNRLQISISQNGVSPSSSNSKTYYTTNDINNSAWHHCAFTWNAGVLLVYVDGKQDTNVTKFTDASFSNIYPSGVPLSIGARDVDGTPTSFMNGRIDEVGLWNRVLSASEITKLYRSGLGVTYPRFSMRDNRADDFNWDTWEQLYDKPKPFPTLYAFVTRREGGPVLTLCE